MNYRESSGNGDQKDPVRTGDKTLIMEWHENALSDFCTTAILPKAVATAPSLTQFKKHSDNALRHRVEFWGCPAEPGVELDPKGISIFCDSVQTSWYRGKTWKHALKYEKNNLWLASLLMSLIFWSNFYVKQIGAFVYCRTNEIRKQPFSIKENTWSIDCKKIQIYNIQKNPCIRNAFKMYWLSKKVCCISRIQVWLVIFLGNVRCS